MKAHKVMPNLSFNAVNYYTVMILSPTEGCSAGIEHRNTTEPGL